MRQQMGTFREQQWMFNLLVQGFGQEGGRPSATRAARWRNFRQDRLKSLVLHRLFEGYDAEPRRPMRGEGRYV